MADMDGTAGGSIVLYATNAADRFRIDFIVAGDEPGAVSLPIHCLDHLVVTLPRVAAAALHAGRRDARARNVSCVTAPGGRRPSPRPAAAPDVVPDQSISRSDGII